MMSIQKIQFTLASKLDAHQYISQAKDWYNYQRGHECFEDGGGEVVRALAEYLANQENKTLYKSKV